MGQALEDAASRALFSWKEDHPGERVTWKALCAQFGVSRQALAKKPTVVAAYLKARKAKGKVFDPSNPAQVQRAAKDHLIESLKKEIETLKGERTRWMERWAKIEQNMYLHGFDPDLLLAPLSQLHREIPRAIRRMRS